MNTLAALAFAILSAHGGPQLTVDGLARALADRDVVFLGEEHDSAVCHELQLRIIKALHELRPDLVISMEMFERNVQGTLNDYLQGRIAEKRFLKLARPWKHYQRFYRPVVEYAREKGLEVLAANVPRKLAAQVSREGMDVLDGKNFVARVVTAPQNLYWQHFKKTMKTHPGEALERLYLAQCVKDDTMAETLDLFRRGHPARHPLIVHLCGKFHAECGLGTVRRLLERDPLCQVSVVTTVVAKDVKSFKLDAETRALAHFALVVPEEKKAPGHAASKAAGQKAKQPAKGKAAPEDVDPDARPALGLMPAYGDSDENGVLVDMVSPGKGADDAGIKEGDRIVGLGGKKVDNLDDYMDVMGGFHPGQVIKVKVLRKGKTLELKVKLGTRSR